MVERISGQIERVTYHNSENGYSVLQVRLPGQKDLATILGQLSQVREGEHVEASGQWVVHRRHGRQFQADQLITSHPASVAGIERFLASGAVRGIGPTLAERIVNLFGEASLEVLDSDPETLLRVRGVGRKKLEQIRESWDEQRAVRRIMLFLHSCGVGAARVVRIYRTYGQDAVEKIRENPYRLARDIRGIGFVTADGIAQRLGVQPDSPDRARAGTLHTLHQLAADGHCGYPEGEVVERTSELLEQPAERVSQAVTDLIGADDVRREIHDETPWLFLDALAHAELSIARDIRRLLRDDLPHPLAGIRLEVAVAWAEERLGIELAAEQREAVRQACTHRFLVITGGPGVGKTTLVRAILAIFSAKKQTCVLAAPTGRAAKRLAETTHFEARTLHRLLEYDPSSGRFQRDKTLPLEGDLFVLDEVSMVDIPLAHKFLEAVPPNGCVLLVGDADQLPSVGPGAFLRDVIGCGRVPVVRLTEIFRQSGQSEIISAAYAVNAGRLPNLESPGEGLSDFYFVECDEPELIHQVLLRLVTERIPDRFGLDPMRDIQVLSPMNRGALGAQHLNEILREALNPDRGQASVSRYGVVYREADRVIQTVNDYSRDVYNGDLGLIKEINRIDQTVTVAIEDRQVLYDFGELDCLDLAYVLTIHKSQGSEYPAAVIPLHTQHFPMLRRNLIYTAITRGRRLVVLTGSRRALELATRRGDTDTRFSGLRARLAALE